MTYELFQQGPTVYIPIILISLVITLVAYGTFPLIYARIRKTVITRKKYYLLCYGVNFLVAIMFIVFDGGSASAGPYILWTWVFSTLGLETMKDRGVLDGFQHFHIIKTSLDREYDLEEPVMPEDIASEAGEILRVQEVPQIKFCRKCGFRLNDGSVSCSKCGATIVEEGWI